MYIKGPYICFDNKLSFSGGSSQRNTRLHQLADTLFSKHMYVCICYADKCTLFYVIYHNFY